MGDGVIDEGEGEELIEEFVMKVGMVGELGMEGYSEMFGGDGRWVREWMGGGLKDGGRKVSKS